MLTDDVLLDAEPATEGALLTLILVGNAGGPHVLACLELDPFEIGRYAGEDLFREHSCEGPLVPVDREAAGLRLVGHDFGDGRVGIDLIAE